MLPLKLTPEPKGVVTRRAVEPVPCRSAGAPAVADANGALPSVKDQSAIGVGTVVAGGGGFSASQRWKVSSISLLVKLGTAWPPVPSPAWTRMVASCANGSEAARRAMPCFANGTTVSSEDPVMRKRASRHTDGGRRAGLAATTAARSS